MKKLTTIILMLFSTSAIAESYFCVAERIAQVSTSLEGAEFKSAADDSDLKIIIREEGLFRFGEDVALLPVCSFPDNGYVRCIAEPHLWGGYFDKSVDNNFTFITQGQNSEWAITETYVGKCSKI